MLERLLRDFEYAIDSVRKAAIIQLARRYLCSKEYKLFIRKTKELKHC